MKKFLTIALALLTLLTVHLAVTSATVEESRLCAVVMISDPLPNATITLPYTVKGDWQGGGCPVISLTITYPKPRAPVTITPGRWVAGPHPRWEIDIPVGTPKGTVLIE